MALNKLRRMGKTRSGRETLYHQVAHSIQRQIGQGALQVGDKVPSVRLLSRHHRVSVSTVLQACFWLEHRGFIEARPRSGFYVRVPYDTLVPEPKYLERKTTPKPVETGSVIQEIIRMLDDPSLVPFGAACPAPELLATNKLNQVLRRAVNRYPAHSANYDFGPGSSLFQRQVARCSLAYGCNFSPEDVVATCGAIEALNLSLRAVAKPNDIIAIESPTYFGVLQAIESLGMRALEVPTFPKEGMCLDELEHAIRKHGVKAVVVMPNCHNPMGYVVSDEKKKAFVELTARHEIPVIEDDVYGDLAFDGRHPTLKSFDRNDLVLLCSSVSKVLGPGFRIGWVHAGRFRAEVERLKFITTIASPSLSQLVIGSFLESGGYERYLRSLRIAFSEQVQSVSKAIAKYFPEGTRITRPRGGYLLWVELPKNVDALRLFHDAIRENISILPGTIFSPSARFKNHIRISCGYPWSERLDRALLTLGRLCQQQAS